MTSVDLVYRSQERACGINLFSERLGMALGRRGFLVRQYNLCNQQFKPGEHTIVHYTPSMWAGDQGALERVIEQTKEGRLVVILHGIYGPDENVFLKETFCPEISSHVQALGYYAETVIALSKTCEEVWRQWDSGHFNANSVVVRHPGAPISVCRDQSERSYLFIGGINRPKKDVAGERLRKLLLAYSKNSVKVWVHITNSSEEEFPLPAWRLSTGVLSDREWIRAMANAAAVLCPYETKIQCVSGIMSEAISLGTMVISTDFMFAREMKREYPELVQIEDDLRCWHDLPARRKPVRIKSRLPTWEEFSDYMANRLRHDSRIAD